MGSSTTYKQDHCHGMIMCNKTCMNIVLKERRYLLVLGWRQLLKSVNGKFNSGELTAILGPSGAGKSTLLNILAGYVLDSTLGESMMVAASLKLGSAISKEDRIAVVEEVISLLGLETCYETKSEHLSGGQRRRLTVALELVNNPPVIFLDEPTSGLDNYAIKQCMELLQKITKLDRTVICTIHQPPASLFQNFDQVYVMANGYCVYNGSPSQLVPFMSRAGCDCPSSSTPADYIIELVQSNPENINVLQTHIQNGKSNMTEKTPKSKSPTSESFDLYEIYQDTTQTGSAYQDVTFPTSFWTQVWILLCRMLLQTRRNQSIIQIQFFHHLISALLLGGIYFGTGNDANQTISTFKYCISINVFFMYTYVMSPVLLFPLEVRLLKREYFNRWYSLKAYYVAMTIANTPLLIVLGVMFMMIIYVLADQPWEFNRILMFNLMGLAVALCSQGLGYAIGAAFDILNGSVVAPHILALLLALAVYGMGYKTGIEPLMKILMTTSYLRFGLAGFSATLFNHRKPMKCDELYCHYRNPELLLADMGMDETQPINQIIVILAFLVLFRIISYLSLKYNMTSELRNTIVHYAAKIVKKET
ncbi:hypothetical protein NQ317_002065 [Molorchus minor]|uniref:ABC transporter domain-containing protein n=1 Tax=Molorchus minor TaxID=1323400 RepID=A0ABQ9JDA8_9CUCU|nr:hypothetical protein NQ317_002065 [Molorchus minor]